MKKHEHVWPSVRKVRYVSQIMALVDYVVEFDGKPHSIEAFRQKLIADRIRREELRMRGSQKEFRPIGSLRGGLDRLAEDNVSFGTQTRLLELGGKIVRATPLSKALWAHRKDRLELVRLLTDMVLNSTYRSYVEFLNQLQKLGGSLSIPVRGNQRAKGSDVSKFITRKFMDIDMASFYVIRDLFYDLGLINWVYDEDAGSEKIFSTSRMTSSQRYSREYVISTKVGPKWVYSAKVVPIPAFSSLLERVYLSLTRDKWGLWLDYLTVRDRIVDSLLISDRSADEHVSRMVEAPSEKYEIRVSQGYATEHLSYGYSIKSITLPETQQGVLIRYISLNPRRKPQ